jgi:hypothetical protein
MKLLAIPLSQQAGKWLVIPRKRESSKINTPRSGQHLILTSAKCIFNHLDSRLRGNDVQLSVLYQYQRDPVLPTLFTDTAI